jgi:hypothetical protein
LQCSAISAPDGSRSAKASCTRHRRRRDHLNRNSVSATSVFN